ncbi:MAG: flagellar biosynthesis protein FlhB [Burkholderiales bacterium]
MADENDHERTQPASPRRLEQAREEGRVARSQELGAFAVLGAAGLSIWMAGGPLLAGFTEVMRRGLTFSHEAAFVEEHMLRGLAEQGLGGFLVATPVLGAAFIAALAAPLLLSGWVFTLNPLQPDFSRLDPLKGLSRIFSVRGLIDLAKALAKVMVVGGVAALAIINSLDAMLGLLMESPGGALTHAAALVGWTLILLVGGIVLVVAVDVPFQLWHHSRELRMSREDVRRESRENDGDPQIKARIRSLQREAARKRMMAEVPKADVVVTNPAHYAVALSYREGSMRAPRVVAKGRDLVAARIRELARSHDVPLLEAPPLARALYRHADLGAEIPEKLYTAVAEVMAYVLQLRRFNAQGGKPPRLPEKIEVPPTLDPLTADASGETL